MSEPNISFTHSPTTASVFMRAEIPEPGMIGTSATIAMLETIILEFARRYVDENYEKLVAQIDMEQVAKMVGAAIIARVADRITLTLKKEI